MARKKDKDRADSGVVLFDVFYEDGTRTSNRKVPAANLGGLDGDDPAKTYIMDQDRKIADLSGKAPRPIKSLIRSSARARADAFADAGARRSARDRVG
jgi:hypothetical protein